MRRDALTTKVHLYSGLFAQEPSKGQRRMMQIVEAAIKSYCTVGVENTTYDSIAKACKTSRSLVQHYFKDKDEIFELVVKYIRLQYQQYAIDAFSTAQDPVGRLEAYARATVRWIVDYPQYQKVWNLFFYYCGINARWRKLETELVTMGHDRITALLQEGADRGVFASDNLRRRAKQIQTLLTGAIVTGSTENLYVAVDDYIHEIVAGCLVLARG